MLLYNYSFFTDSCDGSRESAFCPSKYGVFVYGTFFYRGYALVGFVRGFLSANCVAMWRLLMTNGM